MTELSSAPSPDQDVQPDLGLETDREPSHIVNLETANLDLAHRVIASRGGVREYLGEFGEYKREIEGMGVSLPDEIIQNSREAAAALNRRERDIEVGTLGYLEAMQIPVSPEQAERGRYIHLPHANGARALAKESLENGPDDIYRAVDAVKGAMARQMPEGHELPPEASSDAAVLRGLGDEMSKHSQEEMRNFYAPLGRDWAEEGGFTEGATEIHGRIADRLLAAEPNQSNPESVDTSLPQAPAAPLS